MLTITQKAGLTLDQFVNLFSHEHWIDAEDALQTHFADEIVDFVIDDMPPEPQPAPSQSSLVKFNVRN